MGSCYFSDRLELRYTIGLSGRIVGVVEDQEEPTVRGLRCLRQLLWLQEAGFDPVECFWRNADKAIFGGIRSD